jgi:hypothetical protein
MPVLVNFITCACVLLITCQQDGPTDVRSQETDRIEPASCLPSDPWLDAGHGPPRRSCSGQWQLTWDDRIDSRLDEEQKSCTIEFMEIDGSLTGRFVGPVAGSERDAIIGGRIDGEGPCRIFCFEQRENGYVCSYQAIDNGGEITGVWHDTKNRSGDFSLKSLMNAGQQSPSVDAVPVQEPQLGTLAVDEYSALVLFQDPADDGESYRVTIAIPKPWDAPAIKTERIDVWLLTRSGNALPVTQRPVGDVLVEAGSIGATASAIYFFERSVESNDLTAVVVSVDEQPTAFRLKHSE